MQANKLSRGHIMAKMDIQTKTAFVIGTLIGLGVIGVGLYFMFVESPFPEVEYLPWILIGVGIYELIMVVVMLAIRRKKIRDGSWRVTPE
jgi:tellurite resistance protein TehA-like permease